MSQASLQREVRMEPEAGENRARGGQHGRLARRSGAGAEPHQVWPADLVGQCSHDLADRQAAAGGDVHAACVAAVQHGDQGSSNVGHVHEVASGQPVTDQG